MTNLREKMEQEYKELQKNNRGETPPTKKPISQKKVEVTNTDDSMNLREKMEQEFKQNNNKDTATIATETYVEKQNNIAVSEDQLREQAALGLPYAGEYDDEIPEIKTIEEQTEENFSRTKKAYEGSGNEIFSDQDVIDAGYHLEILKERGLPEDYLDQQL